MSAKPPIRGTVIVVEDEPYVRESLGEMLRSRGYSVHLEGTSSSALERLARTPVDVILTDLNMPGGGGIDLIRQVRSGGSEVPIVVLTGYGTVASAVECMREGADDYILKPAHPDALEVVLHKALASRALVREVAYLRQAVAAEVPDTEMPVGRSRAWQKVIDTVRAVAPTDSTVLLLGESGTGKELAARLVHRFSSRSREPYVRVNCAAVPIEMWESEFFGHRKGSYTGATGDREGKFKLAHKGTLFMDEIGTMPMPAQAKMLRVLQDGEFDRLGDEQSTRVDVRIVAATNSDLGAEVAAGRFRQDLYYRLNVLRVDLPPLRERPDDLPLLAATFLKEIAARLGRPVPAIAPNVLSEMMAYHWPGNVRELRNVIERAIILSPGPVIQSVDLSPAEVTPGGSGGSGPLSGDGLNLRDALTRREREVVIAALRRSSSVRKDAASLLGIDQRNLAYYFRKHGIDPDKLPD